MSDEKDPIPEKGSPITNTPLGALLVEAAKRYVGILEIPNNKGFDSEIFENAMRRMKWRPVEPYCMYFVRLCMYESLIALGEQPTLAFKTAEALISASSLSTAGIARDWKRPVGKNIKVKAVSRRIPMKESVVIWERDRKKWQGHGGIVISSPGYNDEKMETVEGNIVVNGKQGIFQRERETYPHLNAGLTLETFIRYEAI